MFKDYIIAWVLLLAFVTRKITITSTSAIKSRPGAPASSMKPVLGRAVDVAMTVPVETAI
jgi:hypothetical protein